MDELNAAMQVGTSDIVKVWMNWMLLVFAASLLFVWKHKAARYVLLAFVLTGLVGYVIWKVSGNIHLLGIAHLLLWAPLAIYLYFVEIKSDSFNKRNPYAFWLSLLLVTILISLVFDVRDVFLVLTGVK